MDPSSLRWFYHIREPPQQTESFPTHDTILTITGGSNTDFDNKRQHRDYYRQVNHVAIEGPITQTKWSHIPITFTDQDINLVSFPHTDAMVINGNQAEILFSSAFKKWATIESSSKSRRSPSMASVAKELNLLGSFVTPQNPHIEYITFDVVDMLYPYNAIFRRGMLNTIEVALHSGYLCLKIPATFSAISVSYSQKEAKNIECGFAPGYKNIHFLREDIEQYQQIECPVNKEAPTEFKKAIEAKGDFKKVALDPNVPDRVVCLSTEKA
jgi:hypothetical protein